MNELARQDSFYSTITDPMTAMEKMGSFITKSGLFGCTKPEQGIMIAMACMCERKNPLEIARTYDIIEGKLSMKADAMLAEYRNKGGRYKWIQSDDKAAIAEFTFEGNTIIISYTEEDARIAGYLGKSNWSKHRSAMLRARLSSKAVRMLCPEVNAGVYTPEEIADFDRPMSHTEAQAPTVVQLDSRPVQVETTTEKPNKVRRFPANESKPELPPQQPTPQEHATVSTPTNVPEVQDSTLSAEHQTVTAIIGDKMEMALKWLRKNNWLTATQGIADLTHEKCEKICARPDPFLRAIELLASQNSEK